MGFSSVPMFLDPPNWPSQQQNQVQGNGFETNNTQHLPILPLPAVAGGGRDEGGGGGPGSIRPGSMTDRARQAKIPQPEAGLKCPRCESTNTKFCYFNNYSLTQPRHFCKACRRYWTRGGAMRSVPVGGGCRRSSSKRSSKGGRNRSKSPIGSSTSTSTVSSNSCTTDIISHQLANPPPTHFPFLSDFGNIGLNLESSSGIADHNQWKIPFFGNLHQQNGMYSNLMAENHHQQPADFSSNYQSLSKPLMNNGFSLANSTQGVNNFSRNFLEIQPNNQFWNSTTTTTTTAGNIAWTDQISNHFNSASSTSHLL